MSRSNKRAKEALIRLYGPECFIEKLHLRHDDKPRTYTGKAQYKRMKELTYHHILERSKGGKSTVENGALLSAENHMWFNKQTKEKQKEMNDKFQEHKRQFDINGVRMSINDEGIHIEKLEPTQETFELPPEIEAGEIKLEPMTPEEQLLYEEHKRKRRDRVYKKFEESLKRGER